MKALAEQIDELDAAEIYGRVVGVRGLMIEVAGSLHAMSVGSRVTIEAGGRLIPCEVVGFSGANALLMPFAPLEGVRRGCRAVVTSVAAAVRPSVAICVSQRSAACACAPARRLAARSRRARAQYLHDLLPRPAHRHLLREW